MILCGKFLKKLNVSVISPPTNFTAPISIILSFTGPNPVVSIYVGFIRKKAELLQIKVGFTSVDTVAIARILLPHLTNYPMLFFAKIIA